jgi:hypothetical protein
VNSSQGNWISANASHQNLIILEVSCQDELLLIVMLGETEGMKRESTSRVGVLCSRAVQSLRYVAVCSTSHLDRFQNVSMRSVRL